MKESFFYFLKSLDLIFRKLDILMGHYNSQHFDASYAAHNIMYMFLSLNFQTNSVI